MKSLFGNRFAPVTDHVGFVEAPFDQVVRALTSWLLNLFPHRICEEVVVPFEQLLSRLEPLNLMPDIAVETQSNWTALLSGSGDPSSVVWNLTRFCQCRGLIVSYREDSYNSKSRQGTPGSVQFYTEGDWGFGDVAQKRSISATNQCEYWAWDLNGPTLPFEETERYQARRIRDRFTVDMLDRYCLALGIRLFDKTFYGPRGAHFHETRPMPPDFVPDTYEIVQRRLGITPQSKYG